MTALAYVGAGMVLGILSLLIVQWSRDARWPKRNRLELPGDRVWPSRRRAK